MRTQIKMESGCPEPWAEIHTAQLTDEVKAAAAALTGTGERTLTGEKNGSIFLLRPEEIELIRVERERTTAYLRDGESYEIRRRLYDLEAALSPGFLRISKSTLVNFQRIRSVEPTIGGLMRLLTRSGQSDYISRKYLPAFKAALGLGGKKE